jgi:hypothetical protein
MGQIPTTSPCHSELARRGGLVEESIESRAPTCQDRNPV